jgi:hypothetical protein
MNPSPGKYNNAFKITGYSVGGTAKTLPIKLAGGECVDITVQFDPSVSPDSVQTQNYSVASTACITPSIATATSGVKLGPPAILGADIKPTILSCDTKDTSVVITNSNGVNSPAMTITNINVTGPDKLRFTTTNPASMSVPGGSSVKIPVTFSPIPSPGPTATSYSANVVVTLTDASGKIVTLTAPVTGSSNGMSAAVSSNFTVQKAQADANTVLPLPINVAFNRNSLSDPIEAFGIMKITLRYTYNTDILDLVLVNKIPKMTGLPAGWIVDAASNVVSGTPGTLTLILDGTAPLSDADLQTSNGVLGQLSFTPTLAKSGSKVATVTLAPPDLRMANDSVVGGCLAVTQTGTQFSLVYACGDSTLAYFLTNGNAPSMIKPVNPNPVSLSNGGVVNFQYVTRHEGIVSLIIYDELGKEVARVVNAQFHPAGTYEVRTDVSRLTSGSYIYRFQLDNHHAISGRLVVSN